MHSHVPAPRRKLRTCIATIGAGALGFGALIAPAAASPSYEPLNDKDATVLVGSSTTQASVAGSTYSSRATGEWFVEFHSLPIVEGGTQGRVNAELRSFESAVADLDVEVTASHNHLWSGAVVSADQDELNKVLDRVDVAGVYPVLLVDAPEKIDLGSSPEMQFANEMTGADIVQEAGFTGEGQTIAIIDTGVDIEHPAFGGNGGESSDANWSPALGNGAQIIGGYDLVGDAYNADASDPAYSPIPEPDQNPDDCGGHGTHVAGIAAGNDGAGFVGVAPDAKILAYRVFGCNGSTNSAIMVEAMERAAVDGADIVNMSIGASFMTWPNYPTAVAANNLVDAGVVVAVSQGNSGASGIFSGGAPAVASKVISVASADNVMSEAPGFAVSGLEDLIGYSPASGSPAPTVDGEALELIAYPDDQITGGVPLEGAEGKVVIVRRGTSTFHEKALAAQESGAAAVIIDNNVAGAINATVEGETQITIPTVTISMDDGNAIRAELAAAEEAPTLTWSNEKVLSEIGTGGLISDFSSYGIAADLTLKPQVTAPGGFINSAYPLDAADGDGSGYASLSGTSMAAPHVAGVAALLLEANPSLSPADVRTSLQNTADPLPWSLNPGSGLWESVHRQGAGMVNVPRAIVNSYAGSTVTPSEINLLDADTGASETHTLSITNRSGYEITYEPYNVPGVATNGINELPDYYGAYATVDFSADEVTVAPGQTVTLNVTITEPVDFEGGIYGGQIALFGDNGSQIVVPYGGMAGDYETDNAFMLQWTYADYGYTAEDLGGADPNTPIYSTPGLGVLDSCSKIVDGSCVLDGYYSWGHDDYLYTMEDGDVPYAILHIENPISYLKMEAFHANADGTKGNPVSPDYNIVYESNAEGSSPGIQVYPWDGTYTKSSDSDQLLNVLDGDYILEVTAVKGVGSIDNPDHVEVWTSDVFTIDRDGYPGEGPGDGTIDEDIDRGFLLYNDFTSAADHAFNYGRVNDEVFAGDWDGDGVDTLAVRRGKTFFVQNQLLGGNAEVEFNYGRLGDEVLVGDWDGDGKDSFAVRRGTTFFAQNDLRGGNAEAEFNYGRLGDQVYAGDWDGDGKDSFAVRRGNAFYVRNTLTGGPATTTFNYGRVSDEVLVGDWDGDGEDTITLRRGNVFYISNSLVSGNAQNVYTLGRASDEVIVGDWNGDDIDTIGLRR